MSAPITWIVGPKASGKSTLAAELKEELRNQGLRVEVMDIGNVEMVDLLEKRETVAVDRWIVCSEFDPPPRLSSRIERVIEARRT